MAKYKIVNRRKKISPAAEEPTPKTVATEETFSANVPQSGEAAFRMFEEHFSAPAQEKKTEENADLFAPTGKEREDLVDPKTTVPTREFDLNDVLSTFAKKGGDEDVKRVEEPVEEPVENDHVRTLFASLFGEELTPKKADEGAIAATAAVPAIPAQKETPAAGGDTIRMPSEVQNAQSIGVSSDTMRVPEVGSTPLPHETFKLPEQAPTPTRATITDLIENALEEPTEKREEEEIDDFTRPEDADALFVEYKKKSKGLWRRLIGLFGLFVAALYLESATYNLGAHLPLPDFLTPGRFGLVYLLLDLQLILLAVACSWTRLKEGIRALFAAKANADSVAVVALFVSLLHLGILAVFFPTAEDYVLFGALAVFLALCSVLRAIFEHRANALALQTLAGASSMYAAAKAGENSAELAAFADHIGDVLPEAYSVSRAAFADSFVRRTTEKPKNGSFAVALPICLLISVGIGVWCYVGGGSRDAIVAIDAFVCAVMMSLPAAGIFTQTLPYFFAQRRAVKTGAALIGESAVEECTAAEIVSFDDNEVFLPKHVKVTSVRTYGAARIDKVLIYCAQIFRIVGGPLSFVFENSISSLSVPGVVEILENDGDGICARIDGKEIFVGNSAYMEAYEFPVEIDDSDATFENTVGRIMYLAVDNELAAKFYIKYAVSARFNAQLSALNRAGIYAAVKTCDPNVDALLLQKILKNDEYPIGVIKTGTSAKNAEPLERTDAPIVGTSKISAVLNAFLICDGVRSRAGLGTLVKFVSMLLGLFITFVLTGMQNAFLTPAVCLLYQGIWLLPVVIPALFDWPTPPRRIPRRR
ncbi:MAG: hypothetical protein IKT43_00525 [Clostridia bacterium]|nr:hypothetical protein [Clostridia bacterium]